MNVASLIDNTELKPDQPLSRYTNLCRESIENAFYSVCVKSATRSFRLNLAASRRSPPLCQKISLKTKKKDFYPKVSILLTIVQIPAIIYSSDSLNYKNYCGNRRVLGGYQICARSKH